MLAAFVFFYLLLSVAIGVYGARQVHSARDYMTTGRHLSLPLVTAMVFATWFGAETVLGIPAAFVKDGLAGTVSDPFGAALGLVLFGLLFARPLYRQNLLTLGDFFRTRFDRPVEIWLSVAIAFSYLGWVSAQLLALGLVLEHVTAGSLAAWQGVVLGGAVLVIYTLAGGLWSVAITTFVQTVVIVAGLALVAFLVASDPAVQGIVPVVERARLEGKLALLPSHEPWAWLGALFALLNMTLGSIAQQDVFQRANAARSEAIAVWGNVLGGLFYLAFAFVPMWLTSAALTTEPQLAALAEEDPQRVLPAYVAQALPLWAQGVFYGALLSVILSTAAGALLAPSLLLSENVLREAFPALGEGRRMLLALRATVGGCGIAVIAYALYSLEHRTPLLAMVDAANEAPLACALAPLAAGLFWRRANRRGARLAIALGLVTWVTLEILRPQATLPPQFAGLLASSLGMIVGSLLPQASPR